MTALRVLHEQIAKIGYSAVVPDYKFSDVFAATATNRNALLAAFTQSPPSYRNAALAVVRAENNFAADVVFEFRALGAPLLFVIEGDDVTVWKVQQDARPKQLRRVSLDQLPELFSENRNAWSPRSIHFAKSIGQFDRQYQLDFVDLGLLPAIEGEIHTKLDQLLHEAMAEAIESKGGRVRIDEHVLFRSVFRFLAAKILSDREHDLSKQWHPEKVETVLDAISKYYGLSSLAAQPGTSEYRVLDAVWQRIRHGINFQNISADDLAFVYENTLVTPDVREKFGTHSTPRQVAEYVVCNLGLHNHKPEDLRIYEPFAGAAPFLVSALRHLRERLPPDWTDPQRHEFLVKRIFGDETDAFACEVATLSLILADYPNRNGWQIHQTNLFRNDTLSTRMRGHNVILCNPPFESFSEGDRRKYPIVKKSLFQPIAVLSAALDAHPLAIGFVLPRPFIIEKQYAEQRRRIERLYGQVELVALPDRIFRVSKTETALLIAREPRSSNARMIKLKSTDVADRDRDQFLKTGETTVSRELERTVSEVPTGTLWIPPLQPIWDYLRQNSVVGDKVEIHRGIEWNYEQDKAWSETRKPGYRRGLHSARGARQFILSRPTWLDCNERSLRGGAISWPWRKPKLIANAIRLSRGGWRIGAGYDDSGLICSQQYFGLWPILEMSKSEMLEMAAILNGPLANAFLSIQSPQKGTRITAVKAIPLPRHIPARLSDLVTEYLEAVEESNQLFETDSPRVNDLLMRIDAAVLEGYDLPPKLERELLDYFKGEERPVAHPWKHWLPDNFKPYIPLQRYLSEEYRIATSGRILDVFKPLPENEAAALREFMD